MRCPVSNARALIFHFQPDAFAVQLRPLSSNTFESTAARPPGSSAPPHFRRAHLFGLETRAHGDPVRSRQRSRLRFRPVSRRPRNIRRPSKFETLRNHTRKYDKPNAAKPPKTLSERQQRSAPHYASSPEAGHQCSSGGSDRLLHFPTDSTNAST